MSTHSIFSEYWSEFASRSKEERRAYFDSLSEVKQNELLQSYRSEKWPELFLRNEVDRLIDEIKQTHGVDLIDLRIKAIKDGKVFLIEKSVWELAESLYDYEDLVDLTFIFGDLLVISWGKNKQFYRVRSRKRRR